MSYSLLPYGQSLSLLTDLYQLTMAYGYWKSGMHEHEAVFHAYFRKNPFEGGYAIACGLAYVIDLLEHFEFAESDLGYLAGLRGADGMPLFERDFLAYLAGMRFACDIDAMPEGTVVFPNEPLLRVRGPLIQAQLLETLLLNVLNFQTLIATKAARVCQAAEGDTVLEFGLRRAQGMDGGLSASRAAYVGGCHATSNVLAGRLFDIPVRGTHAHSWVMAFGSEDEAFAAYARALPHNCVFLVDTYDTLEGVRHAIEAGRRLREVGHDLLGIRLDSGDLAYLSIEARRMLDEAGFPQAQIVASSDLNEKLIRSLKQQGARIDVWGVGTQLATAFDQPALGGVYKLAALRAPGSDWRYTIKLSEQSIKISTPGILQVRRFFGPDRFIADMILDTSRPEPSEALIVDPLDLTHRKRIEPGTPHTDLLVPVFRAGRPVYEAPPLAESRSRAQAQLAMLHPGIRRFENPHGYPAGLEQGLYQFKIDRVLEARESRSLR